MFGLTHTLVTSGINLTPIIQEADGVNRERGRMYGIFALILNLPQHTPVAERTTI